MKKVYFVRVWTLDWFGYYYDSPEFDSYQKAKEWVAENIRFEEDYCYIDKEKEDE